jgi:hypothetical protein
MNRARAGSIAVALLALAIPLESQAQVSGGGQRRPRSDMPARETREDTPPRVVQAPDPVIALERELPSLRTDLGLDEKQKALWGPFERSVRDAAELTRQKTKKLMAPRPVDAPVPNATAVLASLADDERMRAEAIGDAAARLRALYEALSAPQRAMLDRRVLLSQSEPLGPPR